MQASYYLWNILQGAASFTRDLQYNVQLSAKYQIYAKKLVASDQGNIRTKYWSKQTNQLPKMKANVMKKKKIVVSSQQTLKNICFNLLQHCLVRQPRLHRVCQILYMLPLFSRLGNIYLQDFFLYIFIEQLVNTFSLVSFSKYGIFFIGIFCSLQNKVYSSLGRTQ